LTSSFVLFALEEGSISLKLLNGHLACGRRAVHFRRKYGAIGLVIIIMVCFSIFVWPRVSATPDPVGISWYVTGTSSTPIDGANLTIYWATSPNGPFTIMPFDDGAGTYILDRIANVRQNPIITGYWNPDHPSGMAVAEVHPQGGISGLCFYARIDYGVYSWYWPVASSYKPGDPSWAPVVASGSPSGYAAAGPAIGNGVTTAYPTQQPPVQEYYLTDFSPYDSPTPTSGWYGSGANITASVTSPWLGPAGTRYVCTGWTGTGSVPPSGTTSIVTFTITQNSSITWNWKTQYQITVIASPAGAIGGTFNVTYTQCGTTYTNVQKTTPWTEWVDASTAVTVSEPQDTMDVSLGTRYKFDHYDPSASVTMDLAKTITLVYKIQYYLTVNTNPAEVLTLNPAAVSGQGWYDSGLTATVDAVQTVNKVVGQSRYDFGSWTGATPTGVGNQATVFMDGPKTATANYKLQYLLKVLTDPTGLSPLPTRNPVGQAGPVNGWWYDASTGVTLTAQTVTGYTFSYWDVDGASQGSLVNPITVTVTTNHTATAHYVQVLSVTINPVSSKIKIGESVTFTSSVLGGSSPYSYQWYLNGSAVSGATSPTWTFAPNSLQPIGNYTVYLIVTDSLTNTAQSNVAIVTVAPPLSVTISPMSASILPGQPVTFTSNVCGGYPPYSYQWYLNSNPVSGATLNSWTFTPTTGGIYYVYLKVTDANNNVVQSDTARITVTSIPVGGYSVSLSKGTSASQTAAYVALVALFGAVLSLKRSRRNSKRAYRNCEK
jgi:hypothetical protein